jgi:hypothetical protein
MNLTAQFTNNLFTLTHQKYLRLLKHGGFLDRVYENELDTKNEYEGL